MADIVYMAKAKWTALLDAIRSKAGKTDTLTVDTAKTAVEGITVGGAYDISKECIENINNYPTLVIEEGADSIRQYVFYQMTYLTNVKIPDSVEIIYNNAFQDCRELQLNKLPSSLTTIKDSAFYNCYSMTVSELPSGVVSIGDWAFNGCDHITISKLPEGLLTIGRQALANCSNITISKIPSSVTSVGISSFLYAYKINIMHWATKTPIPSECFKYSGLKTLIIDYSESVVALSATDALLCKITDIYVPDALVDNYKTSTNWAAFAEIIKPLSEYTGE